MRRSYKVLMCVCVVLSSLGMTAAIRAQSAAGAAGTAPQGDDAGVRAASKEFQAAARVGDEKALQKMWTPQGEFVDVSGKSLKANELIQRFAATRRSDFVPAVDKKPDSTIRFVTPDVAIEDGITDRVVAADGSSQTRRFTAVWVKRDGKKWLLDNLRESLVDVSPFKTQLKPLEWLLGEWAGKTEDGVILVSSRWSDGGNFIEREFAFAPEGGETILGTQRIGWDPVSGQIKSWTFDSQGCTAEERWRRDGKRWLVESADVTADGKQGKTSSVYVPGDEQKFTWEVTGTEVAGVKLKPVRVEFRRAAEN